MFSVTAINLCARLANYICETFESVFKISNITIWSDSQIALHWLKSDKNLKSYVSQRKNNIKALCPTAEYRYIPTSDNPADLLTRGISYNEFIKNKIWLNGPQWLCNSDDWPEPMQSSQTSLSTGASVSVENITVSEINTNTDTIENSNEREFPIDVTRFSSYSKILRVTCYVLSFISKLKFSVNRKKSLPTIEQCNPISADNLKKAELLLLSSLQMENFPELHEYFNSNKSKATPTLVKQLGLFMKDGIIRSAGRIANSDLDYDAKYPILLPHNSHVTTLLIREIHNKNLHCGTNEVLCQLRERFWLLKARQKIKNILRKCLVCLKVQGKPFRAPCVPDLPTDRVKQSKPFEITGTDYTGCISVKFMDIIIKAYIVIFTCMISRAVHLEVVTSLSENDFLNAFTKFCARRGCPRIMYSDNATNYVGASKTLKDIANNEKFLSDFHIDWKFIVPRAPWRGGVWERIVGITKNTLKKVTGNTILSLTELDVIVSQIEAKINDRPLTYITDDRNDAIPLTPSHLILGRRITSMPTACASDECDDPSYNPNRTSLSRRQLHIQRLTENSWIRWRNEYLTSLRERYTRSSNEMQCASKGQIVLIHDDCPRVYWKLGKIIDVHTGPDGKIRSVSLKTQNGVLHRPVTKLYPLEVTDNDLSTSENSSPVISENEARLPQRLAAIKAMKSIAECLK